MEKPMIKTFQKWAQYQKTVRELSALNRRELDDLGIVRADIQKIARGAVL